MQMEQWVLVIGKNIEKFNEIQMGCLDCGVLFHMVGSIAEAIGKLLQSNKYLLVIIFSEDSGISETLKSIRRLTTAPILVMKNQYDGNEKIAAIEAGADEYIQWPETVEESIASCHALIRRFTELNQPKENSMDVLIHGNLVISLHYHKVFIGSQELEFPRREFDLLYLLASNPGRVFTFQQLAQEVWGDDYEPTENSLHSCVRRIRRKLESIPENLCRIENIRGVGYYFKQNEIYNSN